MQKRKIVSALLGISMILSLTACSKTAVESTESAAPTESTAAPTETTATSETTVVTETTAAIEGLYDPSNPYAINPITGVQDMDPNNVGYRIAAVSLNNYYESLPQKGVSTPDVIFEFETEASKTRFIALYADLNNCPLIGCLRSGRYVSTDICNSLNAVFFYWGANPLVTTYMNNTKLDRVDANKCSAGYYYADENGMADISANCFFWRDKDWKDAGRIQENTGVSNGYYLKQAWDYYGIEKMAEVPLLFNFVKGGSMSLENAADCSEINVALTPVINDSNFVYDAEKGLFMKSANGKPQVDVTTGEQIGFTNVFVLFVNIHGKDTQPDLKDASFLEGGTGYYCSNGKICKITWTQEDYYSQFRYFTEDGNELEVNIGKSYIGIVDNDYEDLTTIYNASGEAFEL